MGIQNKLFGAFYLFLSIFSSSKSLESNDLVENLFANYPTIVKNEKSIKQTLDSIIKKQEKEKSKQGACGGNVVEVCASEVEAVLLDAIFIGLLEHLPLEERLKYLKKSDMLKEAEEDDFEDLEEDLEEFRSAYQNFQNKLQNNQGKHKSVNEDSTMVDSAIAGLYYLSTSSLLKLYFHKVAPHKKDKYARILKMLSQDSQFLDQSTPWLYIQNAYK